MKRFEAQASKRQRFQNIAAVVAGILFLGVIAAFSQTLLQQDLKPVPKLTGPALLQQELADADPADVERMWQLARESASAEEFQQRLKPAKVQDPRLEQIEKNRGGSQPSHVAQSGENEDALPQEAEGLLGNPGSVPSDLPPGPIQPLSRDLAHLHARNNVIIVTWANYHFVDFALNWADHVLSHGIGNFLVGAMDAETAEVLSSRGIPVFAMYDPASSNSTGLTKGDFGWGSPTFHKMGRQKVDLALAFLSYELDLCLCDVDTVWIKDPTDYFASLPEADILASSDALRSFLKPGDQGLELPDSIHSAMNIGLLYFRHSANVTAFIEAWADLLESDSEVWDQNAFNDLAREGMSPFVLHEHNDRVVWGWNHRVAIGVLPVASFASGHTFFAQRLFEVQEVPPYVVHTTFQFGGTPGKRHRLREALLWSDPPEYYSEGRFLAFNLTTPDIPRGFNAEKNTSAMIDYHLKVIESQLRELRDGLAIAVALNRIVIMPKMLCFCDRYWAPVEQCRIPGAVDMRLPFVCPMDHILVPEHFSDTPSLLHPPIGFREYSFLENPRTPASVRDRRVVVEVAQEGARLDDWDNTRKGLVTVLPQRTDAQLIKSLEAYKDAPLLVLPSLKGVFKGFEEPANQDAFMNRFRHILDFWCCRLVKKGEDGGLAYNTFFLSSDW